ncbi:glycosyltransferase [Enterococcus faecium]|uniref:glycosyltransferase n=1 Tax=Enterococcus faecium TaxID=1352 RepID=UPI001880628E|nr:glycosyltransferase [Enterococcus faecium]MBE8822128.1 glycosyltransferase family 4 protein [Enterococcus faecium]MBE8845502.1 glycosyltransferase family 4 protein [Enterococcus faecium]MDW3620043.1 glycosyltransferase [Enterococcus faecium]
MRIVVNDIAASEGGAMSVLKDFYEEVKEFGADHEWIFLLGDYYLEETPNIKVYVYPEIKKSWLKRLNFDFYFGKNIVNEFKPDIYLSLQNTATLGIKCNQYVYLHQPLPYQKEKKFSFFKVEEFKYALYQKLIGKVFNGLFKLTNSKIIVQTEWMKKEVEKKLQNQVYISQPKIKLETEDFKIQLGICNLRHFFFPASNLIYKNHKLIFDALKYTKDSQIKIYLTIDKNELPKEHRGDNRIICLGKIKREQVFTLYQQKVLLFPSYIESFGLPLLEAKCFQTCILAANTDFSREILKDYSMVYYFDKDDPKHLAYLMDSLQNNEYCFNNDNTILNLENNNSILNIILES